MGACRSHTTCSQSSSICLSPRGLRGLLIQSSSAHPGRGRKEVYSLFGHGVVRVLEPRMAMTWAQSIEACGVSACDHVGLEISSASVRGQTCFSTHVPLSLKSTAHAALVAQIWARVRSISNRSGHDSDPGPTTGLNAEAARLSTFSIVHISVAFPFRHVLPTSSIDLH